MSILKIIDGLAATTKRLEKESILEANRTNEVLKLVIQQALDPHITFHIRKIPSFKYDIATENVPLLNAINQLYRLSSRELTGNAGTEHLSRVLSSVSTEDSAVLIKIISKDLECGVSTATANKIWGKDFIKKFPCMLASSMNEKNLDKIEYPAFVQTKMDGMRAMAVVKNGAVTVYSRNGRVLDVSSQFEELIDVPIDNDYVIDGELLVADNGKLLDRQSGNGILNKALKGTISDEERKKIIMVAWDYIPLSDFEEGKCEMPTNVRMYYLDSIVQHVPAISVIDNHIVKSIEEATNIFNELLSKGEEGVILKNIKSEWVSKRSHDLVKMKEILEADLEIIGVVEGTGKYVGKLGSIIVKDKGHNIEVNVGTGFNDEQRDEYWKDKDKLIGNTVAVQYNAKISSKGDSKDSLFLPVFVEIRTDKDEVDTL